MLRPIHVVAKAIKSRMATLLRTEEKRSFQSGAHEQPTDQQYGKLQYQDNFVQLMDQCFRGLNYRYDAPDNGESHLLEMLSKLIMDDAVPPKRVTIMDVGANQGDYTSLVDGHFAGENIRIYAFEPSKHTFDQLERTHGKNPRVMLKNFGFSATAGRQLLHFNIKGSGMASLTKRTLKYHNIEFEGSEEVEIRTLQEFADSEKITQIFLLKLDVEGHELDVLKGAQKLLEERRIENIQFEFGGCNIDTRVFMRDLFDILAPNYALFRIVRDGIFPLGPYDESLEIFHYANYYARLKVSER